MKYLQLNNSIAAMNFAECLIGSKCGVYHPPEDGSVDTWDYTLIGSSDDQYWLKAQDHRNFCKHLLVPLDGVKLNLFKCMEHGIPIVGEFQIGFPDEKGETVTEDIKHSGVIVKIEMGSDFIESIVMSWDEQCEEDIDVVEQYIDTENIEIAVDKILWNQTDGVTIIDL